MFNKYLIRKLIMVFFIITFIISMETFFKNKGILCKSYKEKNYVTNISREKLLSFSEMIKLKGACGGMGNHKCVYGTPNCVTPCTNPPPDLMYFPTLQNSPVCVVSEWDICDFFDTYACRLWSDCYVVIINPSAFFCICSTQLDNYKIDTSCYF